MTNTEQLIVLGTNNVPTASQNTLNLLADDGMTIASQADGEVIFSATNGLTTGSYFPFSGTPSGAGSTFTVPFNLVLATVFRNGLAQLPSSYSQSGVNFTLTVPLGTDETLFISGAYQYTG